MALLAAGFKHDLKALFVMNFLIIVLKELSVLCAINRKYYLKWIESSDKLLKTVISSVTVFILSGMISVVIGFKYRFEWFLDNSLEVLFVMISPAVVCKISLEWFLW